MPAAKDIAATDPARGSSLMSIKMAQKAREEDDKAKLKRRRGIIVLMMQFLQEHGLHRTLDALQAEAAMPASKFVPADNVDLTTVFTEYEEFFELKFGKRPKFFRVADSAGGDDNMNMNFGAASGGTAMMNRASSGGGLTNSPVPPNAGSKATNTTTSNSASNKTAHRPPMHPNTSSGAPDSGPSSADRSAGAPPSLDIRGISSQQQQQQQQQGAAGSRPRGAGVNAARNMAVASSDDDGGGMDSLPGFQGRSSLMKPLPVFPTQELNEIAGTIYREILDRDPGVTFDDIAELDKAKQLLKEAVVMPVKYPQFFTGILRPWNGILLFGSSGCGKTLLAKAVATECRTTFFNISASSIVSKWRGDSEKLVRMLFDLALHFAPSTVFIDELDSVLSARTSDGSEHEASRRMKTEFLVQMDGLSKRDKGGVVFVMAASNLPWDLDGAVLRRLEKRIHVGLPSGLAREQMFRRLLTNTTPDFDFKKCAEITEGYSGADIDILCREAMMRCVRVLINRLESEKGHQNLPTTALPKAPLVAVQDVLESTRVTRASVQVVPTEKYLAWEAKFGSTISS